MEANSNVAVVIAAYNESGYITDALKSLENQTLRPHEVCVVDDGSTDETADKVQSFSHRSSLSIKLIQQSNQGIAAARNAGLAVVTSSYVTFLDGDDVFYPKFIERTRNALITHPDIILCFSDRDVVDGENRVIRRDLDLARFRALECDTLQDELKIIRDDLFTALIPGNLIPIGNTMIRLATLVDIGGFEEDLKAVEDRYFFLQLSRLGPFAFIDEPLGTWRRHDRNVSGPGNTLKMQWYAYIGLKKLETQVDALRLSSEELAALQRERESKPPKVLYAAATTGDKKFFHLALSFLKNREVTFVSVLKNMIVYWWGAYQKKRNKPSLK